MDLVIRWVRVAAAEVALALRDISVRVRGRVVRKDNVHMAMDIARPSISMTIVVMVDIAALVLGFVAKEVPSAA